MKVPKLSKINLQMTEIVFCTNLHLFLMNMYKSISNCQREVQLYGDVYVSLSLLWWLFFKMVSTDIFWSYRNCITT